MVDVNLVLEGLAMLAGPQTLVAVFGGLAAGIVIGALPGLTATMAVAVLAPFTFFMDAAVGIPFLLGIYKGAIYGGSIPAITVNTPGTAAAAASARDGYALMSAGKGRKALEMSLYASVIADFLSTWVLILVAAPLAAIAIRFGPPEFALLYVFALMTIASVSGGNFRKGVLAAGLGLLIACVGLEPRTGAQRFTFDYPDLMAGISLVPLLIGMFALSEILVQIEAGVAKRVEEMQRREQAGEERLSWAELRAQFGTIVRSSGLGAGLGALPGLGAEIACWIAYGVARNRSKTPEEYGKGSLEGLAAAEAGNNAVVPSALIPMTVFGIPGDTVTAILLGAFMAQGIMPGPLLMQQHGGILYGLFAVLLLT
ncbi:tripartite tricarboxylate transporter permease, partial [Thauera sp.]|uniref:tripartite tricarboxylate transporter permease n=1 Tax=Thauera sp. TaxID=1905334 RepID=UPI00257AFA2B